MRPRVWPSWRRDGLPIAFVGYALTLTTLTHWPSLDPGDIGFAISDKVVHAVVFAIWTALLGFSGWIGPISSPRLPWRAAFFGSLYAVLDEVTQGLPRVGRMVEFSDLLANWTGVAVLACFLGVLGAHARTRQGEKFADSTDLS